jgi:pSer/pThr/pTyr-binding forkhead associated (FHA) protein
MPAKKPIIAKPVSQPATAPTTLWGKLIFSDGKEVQLSGESALVGRSDHDIGSINPEVDLSSFEGADTTSRVHATIEHIGSTYTVTDLNSTNSTRINGKRLEPDKATPVNDGDKLSFGKVTCTFKKA